MTIRSNELHARRWAFAASPRGRTLCSAPTPSLAQLLYTPAEAAAVLRVRGSWLRPSSAFITLRTYRECRAAPG